MKTDRSPSELIDYIGDIIRERENKQLPTFYTIAIEQYEKTTPVAEKEQGYENFKKQMLKYMSDYNLNSITVQLYSGKSRKVKSPFQVFKVPLKKQNPTIILGGIEKESEPEIQQLDSSIPVGRYYDEKFELQMRIMRSEMEKQSLLERVNNLTEKYEDRLKDQEKGYAEKLRLLEQELHDKENELRDYEKEIAQNEKDKHNAFGNIALGSIGSRIVENFAKSEIGTGVLKGLLGKDGYDTLQGHLAGIENEQNDTPTKNTGRIITQAETNSKDPRTVALNYIQRIGQSLPDMYLRMLYDLVELTEKNAGDLQVIWNVAQQIIQQRKKTAQSTTANTIAEKQNEKETIIPPVNKEEQEETEEESDEDKLNNIE